MNKTNLSKSLCHFWNMCCISVLWITKTWCIDNDKGWSLFNILICDENTFCLVSYRLGRISYFKVLCLTQRISCCTFTRPCHSYQGYNFIFSCKFILWICAEVFLYLQRIWKFYKLFQYWVNRSYFFLFFLLMDTCNIFLIYHSFCLFCLSDIFKYIFFIHLIIIVKT